ncbi:MAG: aromatic amino acid hydroxylase [Pseudomonadota bacterium]
MTQHDVIASLPEHLRPFAAIQHYERYTPRDHAVWRFLLHQLTLQLSSTAHAVYQEGLAATGIDLEHIPRIEDINEKLSELGWRAVVVSGFVPPAVFMEFQAHRVMPIAVDMRSIDHMLYTPAPDIVHESAGHLPFVVDVDYAEFLQRFGELGMHAISSRGDLAVYEAVRHLSIVKESPDATAQEIADAETALTDALAANSDPSEAALLARLHWWTVEYGLVGSTDDYRIFGAGLLSSLGESVNCLNDASVNKLPLTVDAIDTNYDITSQQPQLFVTKSCRHLTQVLTEFGKRMGVHQGGLPALELARTAGTVNTAVTNAGVMVSGVVGETLTDAVGNPTYIRMSGPAQIAYERRELPGHGIDYHAEGFGSPIGRLQAMERCLSSYTIDELKRHHIETGETATLEFLSGITVRGYLAKILRRDQKNLVMTFEDCTVTALDGSVLFDPAWGVYDMIVGDRIDSVFGGSADPVKYPLYAKPSKEHAVSSTLSPTLDEVYAAYDAVRACREQGTGDADALAADALTNHPNEWLLLFEAAELQPANVQPLLTRLTQLADDGPDDRRRLIHYGLERLARARSTPKLPTAEKAETVV